MCGIYGVVGGNNGYQTALNGLLRLSYRGYDSAGIASIVNNNFYIEKCKGHPENLPSAELTSKVTIGHNRWSSHSPPTKENSHPYLSNNERIAVVHNGIIENDNDIRDFLVERGYTFKTITDTEIIPNLIQFYLDKNLNIIEAIQSVCADIRGAYAICMVFLDEPSKIYAVRHGSPLCIGVSRNKIHISSDTPSFPIEVTKASTIGHSRIVVVDSNDLSIQMLKITGEKANISLLDFKQSDSEYSLGGYSSYLEKEIYEQAKYIDMSIAGRVKSDPCTIKLGGIEEYINKLVEAEDIIYTGCGSAFYAAQIGASVMESTSKKRCRVFPAGEMQYQDINMGNKTVVVAVSQSGETADTLRCVEHARSRGAFTMGIVNVVNSTVAEAVHCGVHIRAGKEVSVASTKAVTNQIIAMILMAAVVGNKTSLPNMSYCSIIDSFKEMSNKLKVAIDDMNRSAFRLAQKINISNNVLIIGRDMLSFVSKEVALKIKEISYIHAEAFSASELKHGPLALVNSNMPILALIENSTLEEKMLSNVKEIQARSGRVYGIVSDSCLDKTKNTLNDFISVPTTCSKYTKTIPFIIASQLLAMHLAKLRGCNLDMPNNICKSVSVE